MARFANLLMSGDFACGLQYYKDRYSDQDRENIVVICVTLKGHEAVHAIVDTGAPWCIFDPSILPLSKAESTTDNEQRERLMIWGTIYEGRLLRVGVRLDADTGEPLDIDATAFIPDLDEDDVWLHPNFIGMEGLLSRICFAVDPYENTFYFGTV